MPENWNVVPASIGPQKVRMTRDASWLREQECGTCCPTLFTDVLPVTPVPGLEKLIVNFVESFGESFTVKESTKPCWL